MGRRRRLIVIYARLINNLWWNGLLMYNIYKFCFFFSSSLNRWTSNIFVCKASQLSFLFNNPFFFCKVTEASGLVGAESAEIESTDESFGFVVCWVASLLETSWYG